MPNDELGNGVPAKADVVAAVTPLGWRYIHGIEHQLQTEVLVDSLAAAVVVAEGVAAACADAERSVHLDLRADRVVISLQATEGMDVTETELALASPISASVSELGLRTDPQTGGAPTRSAQLLEIAFDAMTIPAVRPFWKAVLGYVDEPGECRRTGPLVDPSGQWPTVWFQPMDAPRPQRNRMHLDVSVPHDEAEARIRAALEAGGRIAYDEQAPAFWVLADLEGNEVCVTTWLEADSSSPVATRLQRSSPRVNRR